MLKIFPKFRKREQENRSGSALKKVVWKAEIDGPLMTYSSAQRYLNEQQEPAEIVYTFPLPHGKSVISKFRANINGVIREGRALPKRAAEEKYEDAVISGEAPVMLEVSDMGFCSASLGNLKPGEKAVIELEYFRLLDYCGDKFRLTIPTVIGEYFQEQVCPFQPKERNAVSTNLFVDYDFSGSVLVKGELANAKISSPTHQLQVTRKPDGLLIEVTGKLDRDLVLDIESAMSNGLYIAKDGEKWAALADFVVPDMKSSADPLDLSILVDCSGSMEGEKINQAKECLKRLGSKFRKKDSISLARFGTMLHLLHVSEKMNLFELEPNYQEAVEEISANMGGTNFYESVSSYLRLFPGKSNDGALLILTDGEVWTEEGIAKLARNAKRRIFILGFGLAPFNNLLDQIARETGGAYEAVYSQFGLEEAVSRMYKRIRSATAKEIHINWQNALWQSKEPERVFSCDAISSCAFLETEPHDVSLSLKIGEETREFEAQLIEGDVGTKLCQLVASQRMLQTDSESEAQQIGVAYNIVGPQTNFFLCVEREEDEKTNGMPNFTSVPQMRVAGEFDVLGLYHLNPDMDEAYSYAEPSEVELERKFSRVYRASKGAKKSNTGMGFSAFEEFSKCDDKILAKENLLKEELYRLAKGRLYFYIHENYEIFKNMDLSGTTFKALGSQLFDKLKRERPELYQEIWDECQMLEGQEELFKNYFIELFKSYAFTQYWKSN